MLGAWAQKLILADLTKQGVVFSPTDLLCFRAGVGGTLTPMIHPIKVALWFRHNSLARYGPLRVQIIGSGVVEALRVLISLGRVQVPSF